MPRFNVVDSYWGGGKTDTPLTNDRYCGRAPLVVLLDGRTAGGDQRAIKLLETGVLTLARQGTT